MPDQTTSLAARIRHMLPDAEYRAGCDAKALAAAEATLGHPLPPQLRELYSAFDGFRDARTGTYMWPLIDDDALVETATRFTGFVRAGVEFDRDADFSKDALFFGGSQSGPIWAVSIRPPFIYYAWDPEWEPSHEAVQELTCLVQAQLDMTAQVESNWKNRPWWKRWLVT